MKLVELVRGIATGEATFTKAKEFVASLDKTVTVAEDFPAFIVNRILLPMINEAIYTLYEGVGSVEAIDTAMKLGANHPMGPLQLADFIGLDTCLSIMQVLHDGLADSKYRPCPLLVKYVEPGGWAASPVAGSMIIAARFRFRRADPFQRKSALQSADTLSIMSFACWLSQWAGPFIAPIRQPFRLTMTVTGRPKARPSFFSALKTPIELSR